MSKAKKDINNFINIKFNYNNLNIYFVRTSIFSAIRDNLDYFKGKLVDIGCGKMPYKKYILENSKVSAYIGVDIENAIIYDKDIKPDLVWNGINLPVESNSCDFVLATEILEHCPHPEIIFKESYRILKDGGIMFITTPFIFPLHESPHDEYRYTPYSLQRLALKHGFKKNEIYSLGGINASLAQILSFYENKYLRLLVMPIVWILIKIDRKPKIFKDNAFFTGLYGIITK